MIPNLHRVDDGLNILRGGQPTDPLDWRDLRDAGIKQVIKLNPDSQASDEEWTKLGGDLFKVPISDREQILTEPDYSALQAAVDFLGPNTYIHCQHGKDRTGLVVALWRVKHGSSILDAEAEWRSLGGDNPFLPGLEKAWFDLSKLQNKPL